MSNPGTESRFLLQSVGSGMLWLALAIVFRTVRNMADPTFCSMARNAKVKYGQVLIKSPDQP